MSGIVTRKIGYDHKQDAGKIAVLYKMNNHNSDLCKFEMFDIVHDVLKTIGGKKLESFYEYSKLGRTKLHSFVVYVDTENNVDLFMVFNAKVKNEECLRVFLKHTKDVNTKVIYDHFRAVIGDNYVSL